MNENNNHSAEDRCLRCGAALGGSLHALCPRCAEELSGKGRRGMSLPLWVLPRRPEGFATVAQLREYMSKMASSLGVELPTTTEEVRRYATQRIPKEERYQAEVLQALRQELPRAVVYKQQGSVYMQAGLPDVTAVVGGRHIALEVKRPIVGTLSALQQRKIRKLRNAGAIAYVVSTPAEALYILDAYGLRSNDGTFDIEKGE